MGTVHAKAAGGDSVGEVGGGLFEFEEPLEMDDEPISKPTIKLNGVRARVDRVHVDGLNRTKDDIIRSTVDDLFHATDFEDVILRAHKVRRALDAMGCFRDIGVFIDVSSGPGATPEGLEVTYYIVYCVVVYIVLGGTCTQCVHRRVLRARRHARGTRGDVPGARAVPRGGRHQHHRQRERGEPGPGREDAERAGPRRARGGGVQHGLPLVVQLQRGGHQALPAQTSGTSAHCHRVPAEPRVPVVRVPPAGPRRAARPRLQDLARHAPQRAVGGPGPRHLRPQQDYLLQGPGEQRSADEVDPAAHRVRGPARRGDVPDARLLGAVQQRAGGAGRRRGAPAHRAARAGQPQPAARPGPAGRGGRGRAARRVRHGAGRPLLPGRAHLAARLPAARRGPARRGPGHGRPRLLGRRTTSVRAAALPGLPHGAGVVVPLAPVRQRRLPRHARGLRARVPGVAEAGARVGGRGRGGAAGPRRAPRAQLRRAAARAAPRRARARHTVRSRRQLPLGHNTRSQVPGSATCAGRARDVTK
ncbi:5E5 antigen isoform X2 [Spodoptera frugiperda]|uniref:5E5 antigen isoform X2 n=1 Tax=Spodoptera frugiperda TaxID=7108 RepID=A0A9R0E3C0_SPOFR|nr:5E5 antigen isoform X2 [Spodoptera frugiperda]